MYFRIGYIPFEQANIEKIESVNPHLTIVQIPEKTHLRYFEESEEHNHDENHDETHDMGEESEEHDHNTNSIDPHLWLSIDNMILHTDSIAKTLSELDPENASIYTQNAQEYKNKLSQLQSETTNSLSQITSKNLLVFHPAWGYFADEYDFMQIAIEHDGNDPTAEQLSAIIDYARENNINVVFVQSQFSTTAAENIAKTLGIPVVQIDPLAENYIENMQVIADTIYKELQ